MRAVSEGAGAFALRTSMSGCGARNAGAIARERSESFSGLLSAAKSVLDKPQKSVYPRFSGDICGRRSDRDFGPEGVYRFVSRSLLGHGFGAFAGARRQLALLLRFHRPVGYGYLASFSGSDGAAVTNVNGETKARAA